MGEKSLETARMYIQIARTKGDTAVGKRWAFQYVVLVIQVENNEKYD